MQRVSTQQPPIWGAEALHVKDHVRPNLIQLQHMGGGLYLAFGFGSGSPQNVRFPVI